MTLPRNIFTLPIFVLQGEEERNKISDQNLFQWKDNREAK